MDRAPPRLLPLGRGSSDDGVCTDLLSTPDQPRRDLSSGCRAACSLSGAWWTGRGPPAPAFGGTREDRLYGRSLDGRVSRSRGYHHRWALPETRVHRCRYDNRLSDPRCLLCGPTRLDLLTSL